MYLISKKKTINKKINKSESEDEDSEHELFYYANDRIKLMKQILKLLKPKKIKSMAPGCLKDVDSEELNSMLLEELLGISNKRLKKIFDGQKVDDESSSESDENPIDIISLDDITDDDDIGIVEFVDTNSTRTKRHKHKKHPPKKIKVEKGIKIKTENESTSKERKSTDKKKQPETKKPQEENEKLLSVLELLELQARARAIKSQLIIEAENKQKAALEKERAEAAQIEKEKCDNESEDDAIIIDVPKEEQIVIPSSDSEDENARRNQENTANDVDPNIIDLDNEELPIKSTPTPKFRIIRNRLITPSHFENLTITVTNDKVTKELAEKVTEVEYQTKSPEPEVIKEEVLANVSENIGPSHGPIEMIHLDTLDVDLNEIILPEKDTSHKNSDYSVGELSKKKKSQGIGDDSQNCSQNVIELSTEESALNQKSDDDKEANDITLSNKDKIDEKCETEEGEIDEKEDSDNDDVLLLDTVIDD